MRETKFVASTRRPGSRLRQHGVPAVVARQRLVSLIAAPLVLLSLVAPALADDPTGAHRESVISALDTLAVRRVDALLALAERHRDAGFKRKALPLLHYALTLRDELDLEAQARLHIAHGALLHDLGRYPEAITTLELALSDKDLKGPVRARLLNELGVVYGSLGDVGHQR